MNSYVSNSQIHLSAVNNPKMMVDPFICSGGGGFVQVRALRDPYPRRSERDLKCELSAGQLAKLDNMMAPSAKRLQLAHHLYFSGAGHLAGWYMWNWSTT